MFGICGEEEAKWPRKGWKGFKLMAALAWWCLFEIVSLIHPFLCLAEISIAPGFFIHSFVLALLSRLFRPLLRLSRTACVPRSSWAFTFCLAIVGIEDNIPCWTDMYLSRCPLSILLASALLTCATARAIEPPKTETETLGRPADPVRKPVVLLAPPGIPQQKEEQGEVKDGRTKFGEMPVEVKDPHPERTKYFHEPGYVQS